MAGATVTSTLLVGLFVWNLPYFVHLDNKLNLEQFIKRNQQKRSHKKDEIRHKLLDKLKKFKNNINYESFKKELQILGFKEGEEPKMKDIASFLSS